MRKKWLLSKVAIVFADANTQTMAVLQPTQMAVRIATEICVLKALDLLPTTARVTTIVNK